MALSKKIIIVGRASSGKTTLKNELVSQWGLKPEVSYTSRQKRDGEVEGIDYHYVTPEEFKTMIAEGKMLQYDHFNGNYYGTTLKDFNECDVMIMTPEGVKNAGRVRDVTFVIYVYCPHSIVMERLAARHRVKSKEDMRAIQERVNADNLQFIEFEKSKLYDIQVDSSMPLSLMLSQIKKYEKQYR